jgi:hypothetical protein
MLWRPFADIVLGLAVVPTDQVEFLRPAFAGFGKDADLFNDFKLNICYGYSCGLCFSMMVSLHDRTSTSITSAAWRRRK